MKEFAKKILSDVSVSKEFILNHDGKRRKIKNLIDLRIELESMTDAQFKQHSNTSKNDFSKWIDHCVGDSKLAKDLMNVDNRSSALSLIVSRIDFAISILEKENASLIKDEMKQLQKISSKMKDKPKISTQINLLEKDLKRSKELADIEKRLIDDAYENDLKIIPWDKINPIPANARLAEFVFGLVVGLLIGIVLGRFFWGF